MNTEADSALIEGEWGKSVGEAYLLWVLLACHRIYLGRPVSGVLQIVTLVALVVLVLGGMEIWGGMTIGGAAAVAWILWFIVDAFRIPGMVSRYNASLEVRGQGPSSGTSGEATGRQGATRGQ
ncbi:MAG: TM2 domain-containing protein [Gemmatimonadetes bacterium]|nr:TM2 domain-containing protein [Gemmatimonadota bacterium]MYA63176.1 TM2 domain-containing protein [Gemmatimonadota bacterium]MYB98093.1 TM2 domain-containing protein [Gemmatimonadota bacterium]MYH53314.1 TM2 domain-containing protein [Gemmatimonadota bacterium]MYI45445.1 TM2 domain-containing protein [Gemmatimonadota bacterium]